MTDALKSYRPACAELYCDKKCRAFHASCFTALYRIVPLCYIGGEGWECNCHSLQHRMIGEKLGNYTILQAVGTGSMGTVYRAEDSDGRPVALKLVPSRILHSMELRERFLRGAFAASGIHHQGVCPVLEIGDDTDDFFLVMPFIDGRTLEHCMQRKPIPRQRALDIALAVASALQVIHEAGAVHRGLKPANIWILNGPDLNVQISDCCIARFTETTGCRRSRSLGVGIDFADTPLPPGALAYMSPEQVRGEPVDNRTDIFSFGVVLYEMLSGRHPFEARDSLSRISAILEAEPPLLACRQNLVPGQLVPILSRALAKEREDRYQNIQQMLAEVIKSRNKIEALPPRDLPAGILKWFVSRLGHHS